MAKPYVIVIMDSFKGSLSSVDAVSAVKRGFEHHQQGIDIHAFPLADGGEGSLDVLESQLKTERITLTVLDPLAQTCTASYLKDDFGKAYIELAQASGLHHVTPTPKSAWISTTYGTGQLIHDAIENGANDISVFLGGSATSDGGIGMLQALGFVFYDQNDKALPNPKEQQETNGVFQGTPLAQITHYSTPEGLQEVTFRVIVDVQNPLTGPYGASHIYGPQKGADPETIDKLNGAHCHLAQLVEKTTGTSFADIPGSGAAGGTAFSLLAFLGAQKINGPQFFLELIDFGSHLQNATLLITGEGCLDAQSLRGKLLSELLEQTKESRIPLISLCGAVNLSIEELSLYPHLYAFGLGHVEGLSNPAKGLEVLAYQIAHLFLLSHNYRG